ATLVTAHSEKEKAAPTFKRGFGFHPLCAFVDHGSAGTGESLAILLRAGNAGSNTAADHKTVLACRAGSNCPFRSAIGSARKFWCAPTPPGPPTNSSTT
ncbi:putative transposase, partial [Mycobacterium kansasii 732]